MSQETPPGFFVIKFVMVIPIELAVGVSSSDYQGEVVNPEVEFRTKDELYQNLEKLLHTAKERDAKLRIRRVSFRGGRDLADFSLGVSDEDRVYNSVRDVAATINRVLKNGIVNSNESFKKEAQKFIEKTDLLPL